MLAGLAEVAGVTLPNEVKTEPDENGRSVIRVKLPPEQGQGCVIERYEHFLADDKGVRKLAPKPVGKQADAEPTAKADRPPKQRKQA
jgi:hypothetical protein